MKNRSAVSLGKKLDEACRKKHGPKFNEHMRDLSKSAAKARIDKATQS
jgi:hypothetical protein